MKPTRPEDGIVDLVDVILRDGAIIQADVIITVADVPLVGLKLRAALAGMDTMTEYGLFEAWDERQRQRHQHQHQEQEQLDSSTKKQ